MGNEEKGLQTGLGDAQLLTFSQPIYHQCHPPDLHGDGRDRAARAKAAVSQAGCISLLQDLTLACTCRPNTQQQQLDPEVARKTRPQLQAKTGQPHKQNGSVLLSPLGTRGIPKAS